MKMSDLWRLIPTPPHASLHKALWARGSRTGNNVQQVKTIRKTQHIRSKAQIYALQSLYFKRDASVRRYLVFLVKKIHVFIAAQGSQKMAEPITIPHFIKRALATFTVRNKNIDNPISKTCPFKTLDTYYKHNVTFTHL